MKWKDLNKEADLQLAILSVHRAKLMACKQKVTALQLPKAEPENKKARSTSEKAGGQ